MNDKLDNNEVAKKTKKKDCMILIEVKGVFLACALEFMLFVFDADNKRKTV